MAGQDSSQERTEAPTPKKREDSRAEGQVPRSQELTTAVLLLGTALVLSVTGGTLAHALTSIFGMSASAMGTVSLESDSAVALIQAVGWKTLAALSLMLFSMMGMAFTITALQARGVLSAKPLGPNWGRMSPLKNASRIAGKESLMEFVKSLLKLLLVGVVVYKALSAAMPEFAALPHQHPSAILEVVRRYALKLFIWAGIAYLGLAAIDYLWQFWKHEKELLMTKQEVKEEHKRSEGDPLIKQRIRALARSMARRQMFGDVPRADVIITNPTHIAVALLYDPDNAPAPIVLAIGQRKIAQRIKEIGYESGVPVIENKPIARALLASAQVGQMIPAELYMAVAEILAFVLQQRAMAPRRWKGTAIA